MRKLVISLLLATAVSTPALAQRPDWKDRVAAHQDRQDTRQDSRSDRQQSRDSDRGNRAERSAPQVQAPVRDFTPRQDLNVSPRAMDNPARQRGFTPPALANQRPDRNVSPRAVDNGPRGFSPRVVGAAGSRDNDARRNRDRQQWDRRDRADDSAQRNRTAPVSDRRPDRDAATNWQQHERNFDRDRGVRPGDRGVRVRAPAYARPDRPAPVPQTASRWDRSRDHHWNTNWHHDRRYDWRQYRNRHRSLFHLGFYYDPFGWGYHRFSIGWRLWPAYYNRSYWLNDASMYNLPYAPWPYVWVRYYNDAVLVNVFTGETVDVVYDFFW